MNIESLKLFADDLRKISGIEAYAVEGEKMSRLVIGSAEYFFFKTDVNDYDGWGKQVTKESDLELLD